MPRVHRVPRAFSLTLAALALALASCASNEIDCPTCPPANSGRITVIATFDVDSAHVSMDGAPSVTIFNNEQRLFSGLSRGTHTMNARLYHTVNFVTVTKDVTLQIVLEEAETKTVVFHHDFAGVVFRVPVDEPEPAPLRAG